MSLDSAPEPFVDTPQNRKNYGVSNEPTDKQIDEVPMDGIREHEPVRPSKLLSGEIPRGEEKTDEERGAAERGKR